MNCVATIRLCRRSSANRECTKLMHGIQPNRNRRTCSQDRKEFLDLVALGCVKAAIYGIQNWFVNGDAEHDPGDEHFQSPQTPA